VYRPTKEELRAAKHKQAVAQAHFEAAGQTPQARPAHMVLATPSTATATSITIPSPTTATIEPVASHTAKRVAQSVGLGASPALKQARALPSTAPLPHTLPQARPLTTPRPAYLAAPSIAPPATYNQQPAAVAANIQPSYLQQPSTAPPAIPAPQYQIPPNSMLVPNHLVTDHVARCELITSWPYHQLMQVQTMQGETKYLLVPKQSQPVMQQVVGRL
jgi:hypothetical protein